MSDDVAGTLRRAAGLMRERAEGCEQRRWYWEALGEKRYPQRVSSDGNVALIAETFIDPAHRPFEAEHIASWNPLVAAAVADWLQVAAASYEVWGENAVVHYAHALAVARAYLGEPGMSGADNLLPYEAEVRDYLDYCRAAWRQMRGQLDGRFHPTEAGACRLIFHNGDAAEAAKIRQAFRDLTATETQHRGETT